MKTELIFVIEVRIEVEPHMTVDIEGILDKAQENASASVVAVRVEDGKKK